MTVQAEPERATTEQRGDHAGSEAPGPVVAIRDLTKRFRRGDGSIVNAIDGVSLDVAPGELVVLLGPSGCGKTTLLRSIAGLERPDGGSIDIHGTTNFSAERGIDVPPERRALSMIFQSYALWPHMTALENVSYPLECQRRPRLRSHEIGERARRVLGLVGIPELEGQYPNQMSGGQQQRVALARALVNGDGLVLFDEPLSNVDAKVREQLRVELVTMQRELGFAAVFVTHDQVEAMELADRIAVLRDGRVAQFASPREIYGAPATRYVAGFIGTTNEAVGTVQLAGPDEVVVDTPIGRVVGVPGAPVSERSERRYGAELPSAALRTGDRAAALWRPERCVVSTVEPDEPNRWLATVRAAMYVGSHTEHLLEVGEHRVRTWTLEGGDLEPGARVWLAVPPRHVRVLPADDETD